MSASLVGSEMCIRDSGVLLVEPLVSLVSCAKELPLLAPLVREGVPLAVSYTHLTLPTICSV
eukprot:12138738-Alexandrium_andersonii.AAC.1